MDVYGSRRTVGRVSFERVVHSGKPSLAGQKGGKREGAPDVGTHWRAGLRHSGARGDSRSAGYGSTNRRCMARTAHARSFHYFVDWDGSGGAAAVERHQRDLQLRRGNLSKRRLWRQWYAVQYCHDGSCQSDLYPGRAGVGGPHWPTRTDVVRVCWNCCVAYGTGADLQCRHPRLAGTCTHVVYDWLLCIVAGADHLGIDLGNLSQPHSRPCGLDLCVGLVGGLFYPDIHIPNSEPQVRLRGNVLDLWSDLRGRLPVHSAARAGNQGAHARADRTLLEGQPMKERLA